MEYCSFITSPVCNIAVYASEEKILRVELLAREQVQYKPNELSERAKTEIEEYLQGRRIDFDLPFDITGSEFERAVYSALLRVPYGRVRTYAQLAAMAGYPNGARAVGNALGKNQLTLLIPCHRVVAANDLGGFMQGATGGLDVKQKLLDIERKNSSYFEYTADELRYLSRRDPQLAHAIKLIGAVDYAVIRNPFAALVYNIIGQQISMKALATMWSRLLDAMGEVTPENILAMPDEEMRTLGISQRKCEYAKNAAQAVQSGEIDFDHLREASDEEVIASLVKLRGIGRWTAQMLLIFSFERRDVFSFDDLGVIRGLKALHSLENVTPEIFEHYRKLYSPCATIASFYLWQFGALYPDGFPK